MSEFDNKDDPDPLPWNYLPPKNNTKCQISNKMFAMELPYYGPRINNAIISLPPIPKDNNKFAKRLLAAGKPIPKSFSWRSEKLMIEQGLIDQGDCGGCWAFALASALGDRFCVKYRLQSMYPSASWLIINGSLPEIPLNLSCKQGGWHYYGAKWIEKYGIKLSECWPYSIIRDKGNFVSPNRFYKQINNDPRIFPPDVQMYDIKNRLYLDCCYDCCSPTLGNKRNVLHIKPGSTRLVMITNDKDGSIDAIKTTAAIQREIMENGPVVTGYKVYGDFMNYWDNDAVKGKIYIPSNKSVRKGSHSVVITGWGTEPDPRDPSKQIRYWEIRNSWGQTGDKGFCKIAFSLDTPKDFWIGIDIPAPDENNNNYPCGGVMTFLPGDLPVNNNFKKVPIPITFQITT